MVAKVLLYRNSRTAAIITQIAVSGTAKNWKRPRMNDVGTTGAAAPMIPMTLTMTQTIWLSAKGRSTGEVAAMTGRGIRAKYGPRPCRLGDRFARRGERCWSRGQNSSLDRPAIGIQPDQTVKRDRDQVVGGRARSSAYSTQVIGVLGNFDYVNLAVLQIVQDEFHAFLIPMGGY